MGHRLDQPWHHALRDDGVQSGGHVGEDDIVRFEDAYGRVKEGLNCFYPFGDIAAWYLS